MNYSSDKGRNGELMTAALLRKNGYIINKMNYRTRFGEIDIIAESKKYIIFVEVKLRRAGSLVSPAESVDIHKQRRIITAANEYLGIAHLGDNLQPRFDVCEITECIGKDRKRIYKLHYIKNAFGIN